jgi:hypothetical protein
MAKVRAVLLALGSTFISIGPLHAQVLASGGFLTNDAFRVLVTGVPAGGAWKLQASQSFSYWTDLPGGNLQPGDSAVVDPAPVPLRYYRAISETPTPLYSSNAVGFIQLDVPAGFKMIANQLVHGDNRIRTLMVPPEGTALYKLNPATGGYLSADYVDGAWEGDDPQMTLAPGEGAFVYSPAAWVLKLEGEVPLTWSLPVPQGFSIMASPCSFVGLPDGLFGAGSCIYVFNPATGGYQGNCDPELISICFGCLDCEPCPPPAINVAVGESFWVNVVRAQSWTGALSVGSTGTQP